MADNEQGKHRQTIIGIILILVVLFLGWQIFGGKSNTADTTGPAKSISGAMPAVTPMPTPKPAEAPKAAPLTEREMQMIQAQQELEGRYLAAVNELQLLKVQRDIAETNKAIASAKMDTVTSEKNIVSMLSPEQNSNYNQRLAAPGMPMPISPTGPQSNAAAAASIAAVNYSVISITEIKGSWGAVVGAQGKLFNVRVGDVLPTDNSKVVAIDHNGIVIQQNGVKRTISLVPII